MPNPPDSGSRFSIRWTVFTAIGLAAGLAAGFGLERKRKLDRRDDARADSGDRRAGRRRLRSVPELRAAADRVPRGVSWALATAAAGMAIGLTAGTVGIEVFGFEKGNPLHEAFAIAIIGATSGLCVGFAQFSGSPRPRGEGRTVGSGERARVGHQLLIGGLAAVGFTGGFRSLAAPRDPGSRRRPSRAARSAASCSVAWRPLIRDPRVGGSETPADVTSRGERRRVEECRARMTAHAQSAWPPKVFAALARDT